MTNTLYKAAGVSGMLLLGLNSCVEPYMPAVVSANANYLVVNGFINGSGRTTIQLSRTANIAAATSPPVEKGARLFIQDNKGMRYALSETKTSGTYQSDSLLLPAGRRYQLHITTAGAGSADYESDLTPLKVTPPIDRLNWKLDNENVALQVSTHDPSAQSLYYRWNLVETWQFNAALPSGLEYYPKMNGPNGNVLIDIRTTPIYTCWRTERPTTIVQTTSAQLSQDAIANYVIRSIPARAERFIIRYSVLVSQYVESAEEFAYLELLRKNTEAVGTVNDPLPVQLTGNVHRVGSPTEPVLGFVGAHTLQYQRLFIDKSELPARSLSDYDTPYNSCTTSILYFCDSQNICDVLGVYKLFASPDYIPIEFVTTPGLGAGISSANADCADCRRRGTTTKPSFW
jgi:hypothetical protein